MPFYLTALLPNNKLLLLIFSFLACLAMYATLPKNTTGIKRPNALKNNTKNKNSIHKTPLNQANFLINPYRLKYNKHNHAINHYAYKS